ncbi:MAG TPA: SDR family NAD(P)-dependent oxidoreductase [Candidatus Solibacter sp.]|jgi:NAD(P)-dependent dehydrogenase (short-subunit alcohol dehydrogenase family)|nr:SDR family NAD(P)-dependent oxidoreductase [Candidatus Solibacter sp.]
MQTYASPSVTEAGVLANRTVIVTGASRGIGAATARALARAGASVVLAARDESAITSIAAEIVAAGGRAAAVATDVTDEAQVRQAIRTAVEEFGGLDGAFNNAGDGHMPAPLADLTIEDLQRSLGTNVSGVFLAMKHEIRAMLESGKGGAIVNMSSTAGMQGVRGMSAYSAAKHAIIGLTRSAALDYGARGIRVNAVAPGPILTERMAALDEEGRRRVSAGVPLARVGRSEEVADAVTWLLSDQSSFVTGAVIAIDGGRLAGAA